MSTVTKSETMSYFSRHGKLTDRVPKSHYSREYFEKEREKVFKRAWLNSGCRGSDLPEAGSFFLLPLPVANTAVLFVRGDDGVVRGFHNVCPHRGNQVALHECGTENRFICSFHGWTFDTHGHLVAAPGSKRISNFNRSEHGLKPVAVDVWNDFIFFCLDNPPERSLQEYLGEWGRSVDGYNFGDLRLASHYRARVKANWKIMLDAFQEAFHVPFLHARSQPDAGENDNPFAYALDIRLMGEHRQLSFPANQQSITYSQDKAAQRTGVPPMTGRLVGFGNESYREEFAPSHFPAGVNPTRSGRWAFDLNVVYPNWWIAIRGDHVHTYNFWPITSDETLYEVRFYYPAALTVRERLYNEMRRVRVRNTLLEDLSTVERTQAVLDSGANDYFVLTDEEITIAHHDFVTESFIAR